MRNALSVVCFVTGVALMVYSSSPRPRSATAGGRDDGLERDDRAPVIVTGPPLPRGTARLYHVPVIRETPQTDDEPTTEADPTEVAAALDTPAESEEVASTEESSRASADAEEAALVAGARVEVDLPTWDAWDDPVATPDTADDSEDPGPLVLADAGQGGVVWVGAGPLTLDASASLGMEITYAWEQESGPPLTIAEPTAARTEASGLLSGDVMYWDSVAYTFAVTVTDDFGDVDTRRVTYEVRAAPDVRFGSAGGNIIVDKNFRIMDGAPVAEYTLLLPAGGSAAAAFHVESAEGLEFEVLQSADYEMRDSGQKSRHLYEFSVYQMGDEPTTRLTLFLQSASGIPAIVRLEVDWYVQ